jgi:hypothetical protein
MRLMISSLLWQWDGLALLIEHLPTAAIPQQQQQQQKCHKK